MGEKKGHPKPSLVTLLRPLDFGGQARWAAGVSCMETWRPALEQSFEQTLGNKFKIGWFEFKTKRLTMSAVLLDGRAMATRIREDIKKQIAVLPSLPGLAVLLVGDDPASHLYVDLKEKACQEVGIRFEKQIYPADVSEEILIKNILEWNARLDIHGILLQLPLPHQNEDRIVATMDPHKDVDGFHPETIRRLEAGETCLLSPVVRGVFKLLEKTGRKMEGATTAVVASPFFARPFELLLQRAGASVSILSANDPLLPQKTKTADLLLSAVGRPGLLTSAHIKPGAVVIDVGTTRVDNHVLGDADRTSVETVAGWLTPVPGGVGPMTVAMLLSNVVEAYASQKNGGMWGGRKVGVQTRIFV